jgi:rare lipoprotein A (peptidoglycan hydrolase)
LEQSQNPLVPLRLCAGALVVALAMLLAGAGSAQAATGGAGLSYGPTASADEELAFGPLRRAGVSWYGPGLWGNRTACGQTLRPQTLGVAHRSLPCGTAVKFVYEGRALITRVIDRGPYIHGRAFDLTAAASEALGFAGEGVGTVRYAVAVSYVRAGF